MLDPAISSFFEEKKVAHLEKHSKTSMNEVEIKELQFECEKIFSLAEWLPEAASRIKSRAVTTHPSKFTHPSTGIGKKNKENFSYVTPVTCMAKGDSDGFLRTGNVASKIDSIGNSADLDVDRFLNLTMLDGERLIDHIQLETDLAKSLLNINSYKFEDLRDAFLKLVNPSSEIYTNSKIKQVYFPVGDDYHQLSILTNSGMIFTLKERINDMRPSETNKDVRNSKNKNEFSDIGFSELYNITTIGYGGSKPQNISKLNNEYYGKAHLLSSMPPTLDIREINFPKSNFFKESHLYYKYHQIFHAFHRILKTDYNNINIREGRDYRLQELIDSIIDKMMAVRSVSENQYHLQTSMLEKHQQIWLCNGFEREREEDDQWLDQLINEISRWIILSYEKSLGKQAIKLGSTEHRYISDIVEINREDLR